MERKKNQFSELLFMALLVTSLRPPNSYLLHRRPSDPVSFGSDMFGDLLIEDVYHNQFGHDIYSDRHLSNKNSFLDTFDTFSYINSLGRFQPPVLPEVNLVAFPVSQAQTVTTTLPQLFNNDSSSLDDLGFDFIQSTLLDNDDDNIFQINDFNNAINNDSEDSHDTIESYIRESDYQYDQINQRFEETLGISLRDIQISDDNGQNNYIKQETDDDQEQVINRDLFDEQDDILSDVSALFNETEFKTLEEEAFGDWMPQATSSAFFTPESAGFYQIGDSGEGCPVYDGSQNQSTQGYPTENHFGTVLYSSLTTLSNTQPNSAHVTYQSGDEMTYLQNVTVNSDSHHVTQAAQECFACYDENVTYHQPNVGIPVGYTANYSAYSQAHSSQYSTSVDGTLSAHHCHSQVAEDCFDKNSDSAVSSMSSERIHTISENDWNETSSNSSRYNVDIAISEYSAEQSNKRSNGAQKKYHMFGKRPKSNTTDVATVPSSTYRSNNVEPNYIIEYEQPQTDSYYPYVNADVNSCPENSLQYYQHCVSQNHSYSTAAPLPLHSSDEQQSMIINDDETAIKQQKRKKSTYSKVESLESHFNRDEKRAQMLNIPIPTDDIVNLPIDEFNDRLSKHDLTDLQLSTIRDIRRRGKNKVAAQNCRKRKLDQINYLQTEVVNIVERKSDLLQQINHYSHMVEVTKIQYDRLYKFLFESESDSAI